MAGLVGWVDPDKDLRDWVDGPADPADRDHLLKVAHEKAVSWAPATVPAPVPESYKYAQILLTKHLWARKQAGDGVGFGTDGYMVSTYPLVREAYDAIRPRRSPFAGMF